MANEEASAGGMMPANISLDLAASWRYVMEVARLEEGVFGRLARDEAQSLAALLLPVLLMLGGTLSSWLYLVLVIEVNVDAVGVILRGFVFGTIFGWLAWLGWTQLTVFLLSWRYEHTVDRWALIRPMGFAMLPLALTSVPFLLDTIQGSDAPLGSLSLRVIVVAGTLSLLLGWHAVREAVPAAREREVSLVTFGAAIVPLAILAQLSTSAGMAPIVAIFTQGFEHYVDFGSPFR
jgi:hypothetical protein